MRLLFPLLLALAALARAASAHEFWIEPLRFVVEPGEPVKADLRNGQDFKGVRLPWLDHRFERFVLIDSAGTRPVTGTNGDRPAVTVTPASGLAILAYASRPDTLEFRDFAKFENYVRYEGLDWAVAAHRAAGLPETGFRERYFRNAKALVQVGPYRGGADQAAGLPFELVVEGSPYAPGVRSVPVRLLWQGAPVANWRINVFTRVGEAAEGALSHLTTDAEGRAEVPFPADADVLLNAVWLERVEGDPEFAWQSWWASLTFGRD